MGKTFSIIKHREGFTIIELAVVLIVVGVLISIGMSMIGPIAKKVKVNESRGIVDGAVESLTGFAASNRRLPANQTQFAAQVPKAADAWGNPLYYIVDTNLAPAVPAATTDYICGRKTTGITVRNCLTDACAGTPGTDYTDISNVAFVVASSGENFNLQTALAGGTVTVYIHHGSTNRDTCVDAGTCPGYTGTMINQPERYDDIVRWVTLEELRSKTGCALQQLTILNNELPPGSVGTNYVWNTNPLGTIFPQGGVPYGTANQNYKWCIQTTAPAGLVFRDTSGNNITATLFSADCTTYARASWPQSDTIIVSGQPTTQGSYQLTVFARDNNDPSAGTNDNVARKSFVLSVGP